MTDIINWLLDNENGDSLLVKLSKSNLKPDERIRLATKKHQTIEFAYSVLCCELATDLQSVDTLNLIKFKNKCDKALSLALSLQTLYRLYLVTPIQVERLQEDIAFYQEILNILNAPVSLPSDIESKPKTKKSITRKIRETTSKTNWPRLFAVRVKRVFDAISPLVKTASAYQDLIYIVDTIANPIIRYLAWIFYVPRLLINLFLLFKHLIPGPWMSDEEKNLQFLTRFYAQWSRRWFELCNDLVWLSVGLINCFWLTGVLAPAGMYLTVALYSFDVILSTIRLLVELSKFNSLLRDCSSKIKEFEDLNELNANQREELERLRSYQTQLIEHVSYEKRRLLLSLATAASLFAAMLLAMPVFASTPVIPLIGAFLVVAICVVNLILTKCLESKNPTHCFSELKQKSTKEEHLKKLSDNKHRFFKSAGSDDDKPALRKVKSEGSFRAFKSSKRRETNRQLTFATL
jgi:uncharacterized membrane protein